MRKVIFVTVVVLLALPALGLAGDMDGIWWVPEQQLNAVFVVRENAGTVIGFFLNLTEWESDVYDVLAGQMDGNVCHVVTTQWSQVNGSFTVTLTSPTTATVHVESCRPRWAGAYCVFSPGVSFNLQKIF